MKCSNHARSSVVVVPPAGQSMSETIAQTGKDLGMLLSVPFRGGELDRAFLESDGCHRNEKGAALFTEGLGADLRDQLRANLIPSMRDSSLSSRGGR